MKHYSVHLVRLYLDVNCDLLPFFARRERPILAKAVLSNDNFSFQLPANKAIAIAIAIAIDS